MKTAIIYATNQKTKKLVKNIVENVPDVTLIDVKNTQTADLSGYDRIGMASGIYYGRYHKNFITFLNNNLPEQKNVFFMYTCGSDDPEYLQEITDTVLEKNPVVLGAYDCFGNSNHPFVRPSKKEILQAVQFVGNLA